AATCWSLSSGGIACQPIALGSQPLLRRFIQSPLPLGEHRIVVVEVDQLQPQLQPCSRQQPQQGWQRRLTTTRLVRGQRRLGNRQQVGERRLRQPEPCSSQLQQRAGHP